jgi:hypothetical protein
VFLVRKAQPVAVNGNAGIDAVLAAELSEHGIQLASIGSYDGRSAMGEDGAADARLFAPGELSNNGGVANEAPVSPAHHRARDGGPIANIEVDPAKRARWIGDPGDIGHIKKTFAVGCHAKANGRSSE